MTLASILGLAVSRRIGLTQRLLVSAETKTGRLGEVGSLLRIVILTSASFEIAIALILVPRFLMLGEGWGWGVAKGGCPVTLAGEAVMPLAQAPEEAPYFSLLLIAKDTDPWL